MVQFLHLRIDEVQKLHYYKLRGAIMMGELKKMRTEKKMTQQQVADLVGISLRSYKSYAVSYTHLTLPTTERV